MFPVRGSSGAMVFRSCIGLFLIGALLMQEVAASPKRYPLTSRSLSDPLNIATHAGVVRGYEYNGVRMWRGVPFAAPPIDSLRFAPPQPPTPWNDILDTTDNFVACPQLASVEGIVIGTEDCLYLDVYTPANVTATSALPVMVWVYGGGYVLGDKWEFGLYDAESTVRHHGHIHVSVNYRLSALGFFSNIYLQQESGVNSTGNVALLDQRAALQWVQQNIRAFGGDPARVTLYGESAGAISVCWHLASPLSQRLFSAAIMESGNCESVFFVRYEHAIGYSQDYAAILGCNGDGTNNSAKAVVDCMRALPVATVLSGGVLASANALHNMESTSATKVAGIHGSVKPRAVTGVRGRLPRSTGVPPGYTGDASGTKWEPVLQPVMPWNCAIDGSVAGLTDLPINLIREGLGAKVPLIVGTNSNEGDIFVPLAPFIDPQATLPLTREGFYSIVLRAVNETTAQRVLQLYSGTMSWESALSEFIRDAFFACPSRSLAAAWQSQALPIFLYHFAYFKPNASQPWRWLGDYHSSEIEYVFDHAWPPTSVWDGRDHEIANAMSGYWTAFAKSNIPTSPGFPDWPQWVPASKPTLYFDIPVLVRHDYLASICNFWNSVGPFGN